MIARSGQHYSLQDCLQQQQRQRTWLQIPPQALSSDFHVIKSDRAQVSVGGGDDGMGQNDRDGARRDHGCLCSEWKYHGGLMSVHK